MYQPTEADLSPISDAVHAGRLDDALGFISALRQKAPGHVYLWMNEAQILGALGRATEAVSLLRSAQNYFPHEPSIGAYVSRILQQPSLTKTYATRVIAEDQRAGELLARNLVGTGTGRPLDTYLLRNATVLAPWGTAITPDCAAIAESFVSRQIDDMIGEIHLDIHALTSAVRVPGEWLVLYGTWSEGFFHWLMEWLPRYLIAESHGFKGNIALAAPSQFQVDSLQLLGVSPDRIHVLPHYLWKPDVLWLPDRMEGCELATFPHLLDRTRERLLDAVKGNPSKFGSQLYIPRRNPNRPRRVVNDEQLKSLVESFGFQECALEHISFQEQISAAAHCRAIVGPHGAGMVHTLFMPPESLIVELFAPTYVNPCMLQVAERLKHRYHMIVSYHFTGHYPYGEDIDAPIQIVKGTLDHELRGR